MSDIDTNIALLAKDKLLSDDILISNTAIEIARVLNLEGNNKTLGLKFVRAAIDSSTIDEFKEKSAEYGKIKPEILVEIFHRVNQRYKNIIIQITNIDSEEYNEETEFSTFGNVEKLNLDLNKVKGGIVSKGTDKYIFNKPVTQNTSLLGLDKLAALKRASAGKVNTSKKSQILSFTDFENDKATNMYEEYFNTISYDFTLT